MEVHAHLRGLRPAAVRYLVPDRDDLGLGVLLGLPGVVVGVDVPEAQERDADQDAASPAQTTPRLLLFGPLRPIFLAPSKTLPRPDSLRRGDRRWQTLFLLLRFNVSGGEREPYTGVGGTGVRHDSRVRVPGAVGWVSPIGKG